MVHESPRPPADRRPVDGSHPVDGAPAVHQDRLDAVPAAPAPHVDVDVVTPAPTGDQVRWGSVWAGLVVAVATFLLLEITFFAAGWLTLDVGQPGASSSADVVTSVLALVAFFLGGLTAAATARWKGLDTGVLHGILVWALGLVVFLLIALIGGGALLGSVGRIAGQLLSLGQVTSAVSPDQLDQAVSTARSSASWASLSLGLSIVTAALGGLVGAKSWPRRSTRDEAQATTHVERG